ncbi:NAD(P)-dependent oxidoreductase [Halapricum hydrolyticum]|uniref:NAD(P)-dependent oxidoreductase n=1 Tax=Halapricum hydrolyticum TaxID=2979991 RepID=A0AAE3IG35_9EURY|nr:NAD(P)-dependent oxidoreductase [Halapricum hydrolyticum]MCU4718713.1 NAD(P)-dependent oxidoreductase [Halapricum hydrolyticum]MCU4727700.1 NAD(P)-dependent oxidoreductase [Halapricum hydrolyticum]
MNVSRPGRSHVVRSGKDLQNRHETYLRMQTIGFIGLGAMGAPMAWNLDEAGYDLLVYNRSDGPTEPFAEAGIDVADSPRDVGQRSDVVVTIVTDDEALAAVMDGETGLLAGLGSGTTVIQMSTVTPEATEAAAQTVRAQNARFVDAPVSGTVGPAEEGTLTVLAGGDDAVVDNVEEILAAMGEPIVRCGDAGDGARMKLFVNLLLGDMMGAYAEALTFGAAQGLDLDAMQQVVEAGAVDSPLFEIKGDLIAERDFEPRFPVDLQFKDLRYANEVGNEIGVQLPQTAAARESFSAASAMGHGDEDMTAVLKYLESIAGVTVGQ